MLTIKGKHLPQTALQGRNPSQAGELQLESLGVLVWELQESPGFCLTQAPGCSCTSPRAVPALESLGRFPQQKEVTAAPTWARAGLSPAPAAPGTGGCSKAGWIGKAAPCSPHVYLAATPGQGCFSLLGFCSCPPTLKQEFR